MRENQQILSNSSGSFKWVAGIYADKEGADYSTLYNYNNTLYDQTQSSECISFFIHTDYAINDKLSFISGVRYDHDNKEFEDSETIEFSNDEISPKISLKYQQNKNRMYYTTISKGYRGGGFHYRAPAGYSKQYDKETLWNYEIGAKNSFFGNRLIVNSAIFYMNIDDMQVKIYPLSNSTQHYVDNAAKATSKGFEIELNGKLTDTLALFGAFGYTDITFDEYKDSKGDYSGKKSPSSPEYTYSIGIQYRDANGYFARADLNGYGRTYFDNANENSRDPYNLVNVKIGYEAKDYDIYLYGKNIFDKDYSSINMYNSAGILYSQPRELGVQLSYRF